MITTLDLSIITGVDIKTVNLGKISPVILNFMARNFKLQELMVNNIIRPHEIWPVTVIEIHTVQLQVVIRASN